MAYILQMNQPLAALRTLIMFTMYFRPSEMLEARLSDFIPPCGRPDRRISPLDTDCDALRDGQAGQ